MTFSRFSYFFTKTQKKSKFRAHFHVFECEESNVDKHKELASTVDLKNSDQLPVKEVFGGILMIGSQILSYFFVCLHKHFDIYVLEVKESIADIFTELPYSNELENPVQLPVQQVLGTGGCDL